MAAPIIKVCDGDYTYEKYKNCLIWRISSIDRTNSTGSLEFTVSGHANEFFPVNVTFVSNKSYCDIQVSYFFLCPFETIVQINSIVCSYKGYWSGSSR